MNLFALEGDLRRDRVNWRKSARSVDDYRVSKMAVEAAQMLCTVARSFGFEAPYRATHAAHPCTLWVAASSGNFGAALTHADALLEQWATRFGKPLQSHATHGVLEFCRELLADEDFRHRFPRRRETPPALAVPEACRERGVIRSYRRFWLAKPRMRYWRSQPPAWFRRRRNLPFDEPT